jgi:hypothetical protein
VPHGVSPDWSRECCVAPLLQEAEEWKKKLFCSALSCGEIVITLLLWLSSLTMVSEGVGATAMCVCVCVCE